MVMWRIARAAGGALDDANAFGTTDTLFCAYPAGSVSGDRIVAAVQHSAIDIDTFTGSDTLTLDAELIAVTDAPPGIALLHGQRGAESGTTFTFAEAVTSSCVLISYPSDGAGASLGGAANSPWDVHDAGQTNPTPVDADATSLLIAFEWMVETEVGGSTTKIAADVFPDVGRVGHAGSAHIEMDGFAYTGTKTITFTTDPGPSDPPPFDLDEGVLLAYATLDARYTP